MWCGVCVVYVAVCGGVECEGVGMGVRYYGGSVCRGVGKVV